MANTTTYVQALAIQKDKQDKHNNAVQRYCVFLFVHLENILYFVI